MQLWLGARTEASKPGAHGADPWWLPSRSMDGADAAQRLRKVGPELPVLLMSGLEQPESLATLSETGPTLFLSKPFTPQALVDSLNLALTRH